MEKKFIILIILMSLLNPLQYVILAVYHPQDTIFNGMGTDDGIILTLIKIHDFGFNNPWILSSDGIKENIFNNPTLGPVFTMLPLSFFYLLTGIEPLAVLVIFKFFSSVFFLVVSYYMIEALVRDKRKSRIAFFIYIITAGLGSIIVLFQIMMNPSKIFTIFSLFGFGVGTYRVIDFYYSFPLALGLLAVLLFMKNKYYLSGLSLGLAVFFYPWYGFAAFLIIFVYSLIYQKVARIMKTLLPTVPFGLVWFMIYVNSAEFFRNYIDIVKMTSGIVLPSIVIGLGLPVIFLIYELRKLFDRKIYIFLWLSAISLLSLSQISQSYWANVSGIFKSMIPIMEFVNTYSILFELPFFILFVKLVYDVSRLNIKKDYLFVLCWFLLALFLLLAPMKYVPWIPIKISSFMNIPIAIIATYGIIHFASRYKLLSARNIIILITILSLPSLVLFYIYEQNTARYDASAGEIQNFFFSKSDYEALRFMKNEPMGVVISSGEIGSYLPYYSNKKSLLTTANRTDAVFNISEKEHDFKILYSDSGDAEKINIIRKYNISYIFYGTFENRIASFHPENVTYFKEIYRNNGTSIYRVLVSE